MTGRTPKLEFSRRALLLMAGSVSLAGCEAPFGLDYGTIKKMAATSIGLEDLPGITLAQASQIPYSSIGYRIGKSSEGMLILASQTDDDFLWTSADRIALVTKNGRIVETGGLRWNLSDTVFRYPDPLAKEPNGSISINPVVRSLDFADIRRYEVRIEGRFERLGMQQINILGSTLSTVALTEHCTSQDMDWEFQNWFWIDSDSGFVWKSVQWVHPNQEPITVEVLRPPS